MLRFALVTGLLLVLGMLSRASDSTTIPTSNGEEYDCGVRAMFLVCRLEGKQTNLVSIAKSLPAPNPGGHSMKELRDEARKRGVPLRGVKLRPGERPSGPSIVYLGDGGHGHFIVVRPVGHTGKLVQVLDPNLPPEVMDREDLERLPRWTGLALVPDPPNWPRRVASSP